uniref:Predicted protein n=1 Tax=Physcomitrium patens TaxID=3218 RepID=A9U6Q4_PHYPA
MRSARLSGLKPTVQISSTIEINELNHSYNQMVEHMNELIGLVYEKEILQSRTELKALQAQIHPHFLFNTLEALYWSLMEKDEDELAEYVVAMADLFRYTITGPGKEEWVRLEDELEHIERYLLIMKMRLGDRLSWSISSPPALASVPMPKLLIQPLVENAILHGIEGRIGPGKVSVGVSLSADQMHLVVTVTDDGKGIDEDNLRRIVTALQTGMTPPFKGSGMGIFNVQQRIKLYYGGDRPDESGLAIDSQIHRGTRCHFGGQRPRRPGPAGARGGRSAYYRYPHAGDQRTQSGSKDAWTGSFWYMYLAERLGGPDMLDQAVASSTFSDSSLIQAAKEAQDLVKSNAFVKGFNGLSNDEAKSEFMNEKAAMYAMGTWEVPNYTTNPDIPQEFKDKIGFFKFPTIEGGKGNINDWVGGVGVGMFVSENSKVKEDAKKFVNYFVKRWGELSVVDAGIIPGTKVDTSSVKLPQMFIDVLNELNNASKVILYLDVQMKPGAAEEHYNLIQALLGNAITPEEFAKKQEEALKTGK